MDASLLNRKGSHVGTQAATIDISTEARLPLESEERSRVQYMLQMSMRNIASRARINDIVAVSNPHLNLRFQKRTNGLSMIESWIDASMLDSQNNLTSVINKGFTISSKGLIFTHGSIELPRGSESKRSHQLILCQVGVGNSFCIEESVVYQQLEKGKEIEIPEGYDSVYIHPGSLEAEAGEHPGKAANIVQQRFLLRDPDLILPTYVLSCEIQAYPDRAAELCNACETSAAVIFCHADNASLCERCDRSMHTSNKLLSKHKRVPIAEKPIIDFGSCVYHPENSVAYYCHLCQVPVCISCKMVGSHSSGDASTHKLNAIREAYELSLMASRKNDPFLAERKEQIAKDLAAVDKRLQMINLNVKETEAEILRRMEHALETLKSLAKQKVSIILSESVDLRGQQFRINWLEEFLKDQQRNLGPVEFLEAWSRHVKYRTELHSPPCHSGVHRSKSVHPDLVLQGSISVVSKVDKDLDEDEDERELVHTRTTELYDSEILRSEKSIRNDFVRELETNQPSPRAPSPTNSISSIYSVAQSLAHSVSSGIAAPGGRSLKELIAVYESGQQVTRQNLDKASRRSSVERRSSVNFKSPEEMIADRMRTPSCARIGIRRDTSPSTASIGSLSKISASKGWIDIWNRTSNHV